MDAIKDAFKKYPTSQVKVQRVVKFFLKHLNQDKPQQRFILLRMLSTGASTTVMAR